MDTETADAISGLSERIDALGTRLDDCIDALEARLNGRIDSLEATLRAEIVDSRRHGDILYESLRNDIRILAEAVAGISTRLDARGI